MRLARAIAIVALACTPPGTGDAFSFQNPAPASPDIPPTARAALELIQNGSRPPDPTRVQSVLESLLADRTLEAPAFRDHPDRFILLAHGFGHMGRIQPACIRTYEQLFEKTNDPASKRFLLATLSVCADTTTSRSLQQWEQAEAHQAVRAEIADIRQAIQEGTLQLPRDRDPREPLDLALLWIDYAVTRDYDPVDRVLDVLDRPDTLRSKIDAFLAKNPSRKGELLDTLGALMLLDPEQPGQLTEVDLEYLVSTRNRKEEAAPKQRLAKLLNLNRDDWAAYSMKLAADWSLGTNLRQYPELKSLLQDHLDNRPARSGAHVRLWIERLEQAPNQPPQPTRPAP